MDFISAFIIGGLICVIGQVLIDTTKKPANIGDISILNKLIAP